MKKKQLPDGFKFAGPCEPEIPVEKWDVFAERKYCHKVKVHNWWYHRESYPKDRDDPRTATYSRLGTLEEDASRWTTETGRAMSEGRGDPELLAFKAQTKPLPLLGFLTYPASL